MKFKKQIKIGLLVFVSVYLLILFVIFSYSMYCKYDREVNTLFMTFSFPAGWGTEISKNQMQECRVLFRGAKTVDEDEFELEMSAGALVIKPGLNTKTNFVYEFLSKKKESNSRSIIIDGKQAEVLKYTGYDSIRSSNRKLESKYELITIGVFSDFGFYSIFIGFPEEEVGYWEIIDSIRWKE